MSLETLSKAVTSELRGTLDLVEQLKVAKAKALKYSEALDAELEKAKDDYMKELELAKTKFQFKQALVFGAKEKTRTVVKFVKKVVK